MSTRLQNTSENFRYISPARVHAAWEALGWGALSLRLTPIITTARGCYTKKYGDLAPMSLKHTLNADAALPMVENTSQSLTSSTSAFLVLPKNSVVSFARAVETAIVIT